MPTPPHRLRLPLPPLRLQKIARLALLRNAEFHCKLPSHILSLPSLFFLEQADAASPSVASAPAPSSSSSAAIFSPLVHPFHNHTITGLDVCLRKPLLVTCGSDKSVRVWNYVDHSLETVKFFNEEPYSVRCTLFCPQDWCLTWHSLQIAFHPSGLHVLVGFSDKLRLLNLLVDDMREYKSYPNIKMCREVHMLCGSAADVLLLSSHLACSFAASLHCAVPIQ